MARTVRHYPSSPEHWQEDDGSERISDPAGMAAHAVFLPEDSRRNIAAQYDIEAPGSVLRRRRDDMYLPKDRDGQCYIFDMDAGDLSATKRR